MTQEAPKRYMFADIGETKVWTPDGYATVPIDIATDLLPDKLSLGQQVLRANQQNSRLITAGEWYQAEGALEELDGPVETAFLRDM
ncbi:hypothetical protein CL614_03210 [archaeon]|nr:hypothetical protein [archaeon]|tara:strand:+ start:616 stop:873 length:258 start_codon:yes stop_codon:yes gene_type:complete